MTSQPPTPPSETVLKVLVFTDLVGSTDIHGKIVQVAGETDDR